MGRRGRKPNPDEGYLAVVPCKVMERLNSLGKTQMAIAEEMTQNPTIMKHLGKTKVSRGTLATIASGRMLPSLKMLVALMILLDCTAEDLYEPYILTIIDKTGHPKDKHILSGSYWHEQP